MAWEPSEEHKERAKAEFDRLLREGLFALPDYLQDLPPFVFEDPHYARLARLMEESEEQRRYMESPEFQAWLKYECAADARVRADATIFWEVYFAFKKREAEEAQPVESSPSRAVLKQAETSSNVNLKTPSPLPTGDVAHAFDGLRGWSEKAWKDTLGSPPKWLESCLVLRGQRGVREHHWNPVLIGAALVHNGHTKPNSVRARFQTKPLLKDWLEAWKTYEADNFDT